MGKWSQLLFVSIGLATADPPVGEGGHQAHCKKGCLLSCAEEHGSAGLPRRCKGPMCAFLTPLKRGAGRAGGGGGAIAPLGPVLL